MQNKPQERQKPILVLGTGNRKKGIEMGELFAPLGIELKTLADFPEKHEVIEDGKTFGENARKKAVEQARFLNHWAIGEDSGLSVDALDGAPGVYSARFSALFSDANTANNNTSGESLICDNTICGNSADEKNNALLLRELLQVPLEKRTAFYTCHIVLADADGNILFETEDRCCGRIRFEPLGTNGFGYDPLFEIVEYGKTFGELNPAIKRAISHRARASRRLFDYLAQNLSKIQ